MTRRRVTTRRRAIVRAGTAHTYPTPWGDAHVDRTVDEITWARIVAAIASTELTLDMITDVTLDAGAVTVHARTRNGERTRRRIASAPLEIDLEP